MLSQLQLRDAYLERIGSSALRSGDRAEPYRIQLTRDVHENLGFDSQHPLETKLESYVPSVVRRRVLEKEPQHSRTMIRIISSTNAEGILELPRNCCSWLGRGSFWSTNFASIGFPWPILIEIPFLEPFGKLHAIHRLIPTRTQRPQPHKPR